MTWRPARSLPVFHAQLQHAVPAAAPPATPADAWGLIGDAAHDPTSDHAPKDFPGWGTDIVTAADFPNRPDLGLDAHAVLDDLRRARDNRVKYAISNGQIFSSYSVTGYPAWTWRPYHPSNGDYHYEHGHLSVVGDARADDTRPWPTIGAPAAAGEEDDMAASLGPVVMRADDDVLVLVIPPVAAGIADPAKTWINAGIDFNGPQWLRIWQSYGTKGGWAPLPGLPDDGHGNGLLLLESGAIFSVELARGVRMLSVARVADPAALAAHAQVVAGTAGGAEVPPTPAAARAVVGFCFERM